MNMLWLAVALRIVANPLSNVFQKLLTERQVSSIAVIALTHGLLCVVGLPLLVWLRPSSSEFWGNITASAVLAVAGNVLIVQALQAGDLSVLGPINSYKPVVSLVPGLLLLAEVPSSSALVGVALVLVGSYGLVDRQPRMTSPGPLQRLRSPGVLLRLAALVLTGIEAVFLKRAVLAASPLAAFAAWCVLGFVASAGLWMTRPSRSDARQNGLLFLALAVTTGLMQFSTLVALTGFQVAPALALFQTSTILSVLLGWRVFREPDVLRRLAGALVMALGAVLIVVSR